MTVFKTFSTAIQLFLLSDQSLGNMENVLGDGTRNLQLSLDCHRSLVLGLLTARNLGLSLASDSAFKISGMKTEIQKLISSYCFKALRLQGTVEDLPVGLFVLTSESALRHQVDISMRRENMPQYSPMPVLSTYSCGPDPVTFCFLERQLGRQYSADRDRAC